MHQKIRNYRLKQGLSSKELAEKLGIKEPTLRSLENGWRPITPEMAVKFEQVTGLKRHELRPDIFGKVAA